MLFRSFKAPSEVPSKQSVAFQYVCQLHMGKLVCENNGVKVDGMLLSQFNWAEWALKDDDVPYIPELDQAIIDAGDHYWGFVLRGELPPYVRKPRLESEEAIANELGEPAARLARMKAIAGALGKHIDTLDEFVKGALEKYAFGSSRLKLDGISYTASPKFDKELIRNKVPSGVLEQVLAKVPLNGRSTKAYDEKALLAKLKDLNVDTKQFVLPGNLDGEVLYEELLAVGQDADSLMGEQLRATVDSKLTEEATAWVAREFADLINAPSVQTNDREGLEMPRCVPRSVAA